MGKTNHRQLKIPSLNELIYQQKWHLFKSVFVVVVERQSVEVCACLLHSFITVYQFSIDTFDTFS